MKLDWKVQHEGPDNGPVLELYHAFTEEFEAILAVLGDTTTEMSRMRRGFSMDIHAGCCKVPQGINWRVKIEFELDCDMDEFLVRMGNRK